MSLPSFLLPWFAVAGLVAAAGAGRDPPAEPPPLPRGALGGHGLPPRGGLPQPAHPAAPRPAAVGCCAWPAWRPSALALAQPLLHPRRRRRQSRSAGARRLLVDNSLSMGYQKLDGTLLDDAKAKAREVIEQLPRGSRISVLPICGSAAACSYDAYSSTEDALEGPGGHPGRSIAQTRPDASHRPGAGGLPPPVPIGPEVQADLADHRPAGARLAGRVAGRAARSSCRPRWKSMQVAARRRGERLGRRFQAPRRRGRPADAGRRSWPRSATRAPPAARRAGDAHDRRRDGGHRRRWTCEPGQLRGVQFPALPVRRAGRAGPAGLRHRRGLDPA